MPLTVLFSAVGSGVRHFFRRRRFLGVGAGAAIVLGAGAVFAADQAVVDVSKLPPPATLKIDFARDIQALFEANCYKCHGPEKQKSEFRLDVKAAALKGGDHGQDIIPGRSAESPLIHYVAGLVEDMRMPPKGPPLDARQISLLRAWIDQGADWPENAAGAAKLKSKADYWVFKPATRPSVPQPRDQRWPRNAVDDFVLARLEREGLRPAREADRVTLIRRLYFDMLGLPPTPADVRRFVNDHRRNAYESLVDELLASPHYGERWGRHWLDVVHYGESHGYDKDKPRLNAWPYRDYVIRAFNLDKPYSRFVREQLAGDVLFPDDPDGVVATGFIAAGPWDYVGHVELPESKTDGLIARYNDRDDMVMTTMSTFQSLTVHCARCHDHKFDPITQADYYSLQAVLAGVDRAERPFDSDPRVFRARKQLQSERRAALARLKQLDAVVAKVSSPEIDRLDARAKALEQELASLPKAGAAGADSPSNGYHSEIVDQPNVEKWVQVDFGRIAPIDQIVLIPARPTDFADSPGFGFPARYRVEVSEDAEFSHPVAIARHLDADVPNPGDTAISLPAAGRKARCVRVTATRLWERTNDYVFALAELRALSAGENVAEGATVTALDSIEAGRWAKRFLVDGYDSRHRLGATAAWQAKAARRQELETQLRQITDARRREVDRLLDPPTRDAVTHARLALARVEERLAVLPAPGTVYAAASDFAAVGSFRPAGVPRVVRALKRGDVKQPGPVAEPGAVSCLPGMPARFDLARPDDEGARRAALAEWITAPRNLLTRRSIVNRVWQYHFGRGIIDSPNDFGHMGSPPTHPELLDWLAYWFMDNGESLKKLHRLILTSSTYRQSTDDNPAFAKIDGDNRYLWRMNRAPLDAEAVRDSLLAISGRLDYRMGGPSDQQFYFKNDHSPVYDYGRFKVDDPAGSRRSVYRFIVRSVPDPLMESLDCADPSILTPKRDATLTALQALATLNDPFVLRQAEHLAGRLSALAPDLPGQIKLAYDAALNREPQPRELEALATYGRKYGLVNVCRLIFNSSEFMFID